MFFVLRFFFVLHQGFHRVGVVVIFLGFYVLKGHSDFKIGQQTQIRHFFNITEFTIFHKNVNFFFKERSEFLKFFCFVFF